MEHVELWTAVATIAATAAVSLFRIGQQWGQILTRLDQIHENQQYIAEQLHIELPYPHIKR